MKLQDLKLKSPGIFLGADMEISHFFHPKSHKNPSRRPDRMLLAHFPGVPAGGNNRLSPLDEGRRYDTANGSCAYSELQHLEICTPIVTCPKQLVQYVEASRQKVRDAQAKCNDTLGEDERLVVLFECRCGRTPNAVSIGTHQNYLIDRETWQRICTGQYPAVTGFVASAMAGIQLISGQGCVGAANGRPSTEYQISQRSDFITHVSCLDTMGRSGRGLINTRAEPECGPLGPHSNRHARYHLISLDFPVNEVALFVTTGLVSLALDCVARGQTAVELILDDPVETHWRWSHDPNLNTKAKLASGHEITADEFLSRLVEFVTPAAANTSSEPWATELLRVVDTASTIADAFRQRDWDYLRRRIDWVLKWDIIDRTMIRNNDVTWESPEAALIDQLYGSCDPKDSLYLAERNSGNVERIVTDADIERAMWTPPEDTRSWGHAMTLRLLQNDDQFKILNVGWDHIVVKQKRRRRPRVIWFPDPHRSHREDCENILADESSEEAVRTMTEIGRKLLGPNATAVERSPPSLVNGPARIFATQ